MKITILAALAASALAAPLAAQSAAGAANAEVVAREDCNRPCCEPICGVLESSDHEILEGAPAAVLERGPAYDASGIKVDDHLRTTNPHIYAAGDVCLEYKFTHTAEATARIVVRNALFRGRERLSDASRVAGLRRRLDRRWRLFGWHHLAASIRLAKNAVVNLLLGCRSRRHFGTARVRRRLGRYLGRFGRCTDDGDFAVARHRNRFHVEVIIPKAGHEDRRDDQDRQQDQEGSA